MNEAKTSGKNKKKNKNKKKEGANTGSKTVYEKENNGDDDKEMPKDCKASNIYNNGRKELIAQAQTNAASSMRLR